MNLIASNEVAMTSLDFLNNYINPARLSAGENQLRHNELVRKIEDEIDENLIYIKTVDSRNRPLSVASLNYDQLMLVGMRESKAVRKSVLAKLKKLQESSKPKIPQTYAEALQLAADQAKQLELAKPKVDFVDQLVERNGLMNATQVAQKMGKSAIWLNNQLSEIGVYNKAIKRGRVFQQWFIDQGFGEMKQTELGYSQVLFTAAGEFWIFEKLTSEGVI